MELSVAFTVEGGQSRNTVENSDDGGCHILTPIEQLNTNQWIYKGIACHPSKLLHGPATVRNSKIVIYPCCRYKCNIQCPCYICRGINNEASHHQDLFYNHQLLHQVPHLACQYCSDNPVYPCFQIADPKSRSLHFGTIVTNWKFYHESIHNHGKAYQDYMWKKDFGAKKNITWDEYFLKKDKKRNLKCNECDKTFTYLTHKRRHYKNVHYKKSFECPDCSKLFGRPDNLREHRKTHHQIKLVDNFAIDKDESHELNGDDDVDSDSSTDVGNIFSDIGDTENSDSNDQEEDVDDCSEEDTVNFIKREEKVSNDILGNYTENDNETKMSVSGITKFHQCQLCEKRFSSKFNHKTHMKKFKYSCDVCKKDFCLKRDLIRHKVEKQHQKIMFNCENCTVVFLSKYNLKRHSNQKKLSCEECQQDFCLKSLLSAHKKIVHGEKSFKCLNCGKDFKSKFNLDKHCTHGTVEVCKQCGIKLCNLTDLLKHKKHERHDEDDKCKVCQRRFLTEVSLLTHMKKVKYSCDTCQENFCFNSDMTAHKVETHHNNISFKCENCTMEFPSKYNLERHNIQKKHSCEDCLQQFCLKGSLTSHRKTVHGNKTFKCLSCGKEFGTKFNLDRHSNQRTLVVCKQCGLQFCNLQDLLKHKKSKT